jgi:glutathione reductase (NADPH)
MAEAEHGMSGEAFDLFIIGAGSGGVRAARMAGQRGLRVAVAEDAALGGTCVNLGCIPKKLYSFAAHYAESFEEAHGFGWTVPPARFDWETLKANRAGELRRLNGIYEQLMKSAGVQIISGRATVLGPHEVGVGGTSYRAERILVATGGWPVPPEVPGGELAISSNEIFDLARFPQRLVVVGGGYIASEFASIFTDSAPRSRRSTAASRSCAASTTTCAGSSPPRWPRRASTSASAAASPALQKAQGGIRVALGDGSELFADTVLYATGRAPNTRGLASRRSASSWG